MEFIDEKAIFPKRSPKRIFFVIRVDGIKYYKPFLTLEDAEQFILSKYDSSDITIEEFMNNNEPNIIYDIDPKLPIYVAKTIHGFKIFNFEESFLSYMESQSKKKYNRVHGCEYINFKFIRSFNRK